MSGTRAINCQDSSENIAKSCDMPPEIKNAKEACMKMQEKLKKIEEETSFTEDVGKGFASMNPVTAPLELVKSFFPKSTSKQSVTDILKIDLTSDQLTEISQKCAASSTSVQANVLEGQDVECAKVLKDTKLMALELIPAADRLDYANSFDDKNKFVVKDVEQNNKNTSFQTCTLKAVTEVLSKQTAGIDNATLLTALNKATGFGATAESDQNVCKDISVKMTSCQYVRNKMCCEMNSTNNQLNTIKRGCELTTDFKNIAQSNDRVAYQSCDMTASTTLSSDMIGKILNRTSVSADNSSDLGLSMLLLLLLIPFIMIVGGGIAVVKSGDKYLKSIIGSIGGILLVAGAALFICYAYIPAQEEKIVDNEPRSLCKDVQTLKDIDRNQTYGSVKKQAQDRGMHSVDFFTENAADGVIADDTLGFGIYSFDSRDSNKCEKFVSENGARVRTYYVPSQNINFLISAIICTFGGVVILVIGLIKYLRSARPGTNARDTPKTV